MWVACFNGQKVKRSQVNRMKGNYYERSTDNQLFVEELLREMLADAEKMVPLLDDRTAIIKSVSDKWVGVFSPSNSRFTQSTTLNRLASFLRSRGFAQSSIDDELPLKALLIYTIDQHLSGVEELANGKIDEQQAGFWTDAAVEDCFMFLQRMDNPAE